MLAIERASFADPWPGRAFREALASRALFLVAVRTRAVVGYVLARHVLDEGEILNLAVAPGERMRGMGRALALRALEELQERGVTQVFLEVRSSNAVARRLYAAIGFREVGRREGYYGRPTEDAVVLRAAVSAVEGDAIL